MRQVLRLHIQIAYNRVYFQEIHLYFLSHTDESHRMTCKIAAKSFRIALLSTAEPWLPPITIRYWFYLLIIQRFVILLLSLLQTVQVE